MSDVEAYRERARAWLGSVAPRFGRAARAGLSEEEALALGRAYLKERFAAGYSGINWPVEYGRSEEHKSELQSLMRISYAVFCLKKKNLNQQHTTNNDQDKLQ